MFLMNFKGIKWAITLTHFGLVDALLWLLVAAAFVLGIITIFAEIIWIIKSL